MKRIIISIFALLVIITASAQTADSKYYVGKNFVSYNDSLMSSADVASFTVLSHGFAKDKAHVYKNGAILEYVDPVTFSVVDGVSTQPTAVSSSESKKKASGEDVVNDKDDDDNDVTILDRILGTDEVENKYAIKDGAVTYDGKLIKKADAQTFKYIGGDYGADKHHAYYKGRILGDAWGVGQFLYKGNGYASDGVHWYCNGKPVDRD